MVLDFRDLSRRELIIGAAGVALLVILFVPDWYAVRAEGILDHDLNRTVTREVDARNAFGAFTFLDIGLLATAIAAIGFPLVSAVRPELGLGRWPALAVAALAVAAAILIALRLIDPPDLAGSIDGERIRVSDFPGTDVIRKAGAWLGLAASGVIALAAGLEARKRS